MPKPVNAPVAPYHVTEMTIEDAMEISMWRAPGPWAVQDSLEPPPQGEGFWTVRDGADQIVGYCCFGEKARPLGLEAAPGRLDVALGMAPEFAGRHLSQDFATAVVRYSKEVADRRRLRCAVAEWNEKGRRTAEAVGFELVGQHLVKGGRRTVTYHVYEQ